jgi:hypothetical protein
MKDQEDLRMSEQVAKDRNGKEIRVGTKVRVLPGHGFDGRNGIQAGEIHEVSGWTSSGGFALKGKDSDWGYGSFRFEVVEESELEELVRKVNEGAEAKARLLSEFREQVVQERKLYEGRSFPGEEFETLLYTYRVKPKTFTPFNVGKGWKVELSEDRKILTIGCQSWRKEEARPKFSVGFKILSEGREQGLRGFFGSKLGLRHQDTGETIPWADVDRIIAELEKVGA